MNDKLSYLSRRNLIKYGGGFLGTSLVTSVLGSSLATPKFASASTPTPSAVEMTPDEALKLLMEGNQRFISDKPNHPNQSLARLQEVAQKQNPFAALLTCADSRVSPEIIFDRGLGDLFVVRVAGNLATLEDVGSEEYASSVLNSKVLMVLGHQRCGAVKAAVENEEVPGTIGSLVYEIQPAVEIAKKEPGDLLANAVKANVMLQVAKLQNSSVISNLVKENKLKIVGAYYELDTGTVTLLS